MTDSIPLLNIEPSLSNENKIQTRKFNGFYRNIRIIIGGLFLTFYFGTVWLQWNGRQAVLWDLSDKKFYIFKSVFWPQDLLILSAILIAAAFLLFFLSVAWGRVWCGYSCPQSVWMWIFMWCEKITEGDRNQRIKLDNSRLSVEKITKRIGKHGLWLLFSLLTAVTFVGYFTPIREMMIDITDIQSSGTTLFWIMTITGLTYLNAGWLREKVCIHMCPYGRFQSVMQDSDSVVISYDFNRGETRGSRKIGSDYKSDGLGDCVDCNMCVQVCPTGIDIRNGLQLECIGCAACVDACNSIMNKMNYPKGLIRYASENELLGAGTQVVRPRLFVYGGLIVAFMGFVLWTLLTRPMVDFEVDKARMLYRYSKPGWVENVYTIKVLNKNDKAQVYSLNVNGIEGIKTKGKNTITLLPGERIEIPIAVSAPISAINDSIIKINFMLSTGKETYSVNSNFMSKEN